MWFITVRKLYSWFYNGILIRLHARTGRCKWYNMQVSGKGLGMAVQHCVRASLGTHCILAQKQYCQKPMAQLNSTAFFFFTPVCAIRRYKNCS